MPHTTLRASIMCTSGKRPGGTYFDGSSAPYLKMIERAGLRELDAVRNYLAIEKPMVIRDGDSYIKASPCEHFRVRYMIDFPHPMIGKQELSWSLENGSFGREIAKARTFGSSKRQSSDMGLIQAIA